MNILLTLILAMALYLGAGAILGIRLFGSLAPEHALMRLKTAWIVTLGMAAVVLHAVVLYHQIYSSAFAGLNFGFFNAISLMTWLIAGLVLIAALTKPVENLAIVILPSAAVALMLENLLPSSHILLKGDAAELRTHIIISILAYSMLSIAAAQSVLLAVQNNFLRAKHPGGFVRALPPLETMESLLFQMIGIGFVLMSLSLISGFVYLEDMFAQHLVHKTILSIIAWGMFAILLWGRWRFGWRGRTAVRWTLTGFVFLLLAYFGSKLVLELVLGR